MTLDRKLLAVCVAALIQVGCTNELDTGNVGQKFEEGVQGQGKIVPLQGDANQPSASEDEH